MSLLDTAVSYAKRGWEVFPLMHRSKRPFPRSKGLLEASSNPQLAEKIWTRFPNANIGIRTGRGSGLAILDIDGPQAYTLLKARGFEIPETLTSITTHGRQYLFKHPGGEEDLINRTNMAGSKTEKTGIDFRGDGGYVVAPPSIHPSGKPYEFEDPDVEIADCPPWLIKFHEEDCKRKKKAADATLEQGEPIPEGERNSALTSIAGNLRRTGHEEHFIRTYLSTVNSESCQPPLPDKEIATIAHSVSQYEPATLLVPEAEAVVKMMQEVKNEQAAENEEVKTTKRGLELALIRRTHGEGRRAQFVAVIFFKGRKAVLDGITGTALLAFTTIRGLAVEEGLFLPNSKSTAAEWGKIVQKALDTAKVEVREADEDAIGACMLSVSDWVGDLGIATELEEAMNDPEGSKFAWEAGWLVNNLALRRAIRLDAPDATRNDISKALRIMETRTVNMKVEEDGKKRMAKFRFISEKFNGCKTIPKSEAAEKKEEVPS